TGGLTGKRWGRIGDSPVIGAGNYADDRACAVSATGAGEFFIRAGVAHEICTRMRLLGESAQQAADAVIAEIGALGGDGGVIVAAPTGPRCSRSTHRGCIAGGRTAAGRARWRSSRRTRKSEPARPLRAATGARGARCRPAGASRRTRLGTGERPRRGHAGRLVGRG